MQRNNNEGARLLTKLKSIINSVFKKIGYRIQRKNGPVGFTLKKINLKLTMKGGLERCIKRGLNINTVIDIGASDGRWSKDCMKFIPDADYILIEAQHAHEALLKKFKKNNSNADYLIAAAGKKDGTIYFGADNLFGGVASDIPDKENFHKTRSVSIDSIVKKRGLKPPFLIKLDTHGYEVPILEGAKDSIKSAELVIIETYNYQITSDSLKYFEMCEYMWNLGFSAIENVDVLLRSYDNSFWQMDTFFIPKNRKEFTYNSYK